MNSQDRMLAEWDCIRLSHAFAYNLDHRKYEDLADLFAPDGVWVRHGTRLQGHKEILAAMQTRTQFTRHVTTGVHFIEMTDKTAKSFAYNMSYFVLGELNLPAPYNPADAMLLDFKDTYVKTEKGWRFAERVTQEILIPETVQKMHKSH